MRKTKENTELSILRILQAAEVEMCQRGFATANMEAIAKGAGLTKGAIFWHFESKAVLFQAVIKKAAQNLNAIIDKIFTSNKNIIEKCREAVKQIKKDTSFSVLIMLLNHQDNIPKEVFNACSKEATNVFLNIHNYLSVAQKQGELQEDIEIQDVLFPIILTMIGFTMVKELRNLISPLGNTIKDEKVIDAIFNGIASFQKER
jgi:AcrR family transcriptional regulator